MESNRKYNLKRIGVIDIALAIVMLVGTAISLPLVRLTPPGTIVQVYHGDRVEAEYPLGRNRDFVVQGDIGTVKIRIHDHSVSVIDAQCPRHLCTKSGSIRRNGHHIICAPNHILVQIVEHGSSTTDTPDAITP